MSCAEGEGSGEKTTMAVPKERSSFAVTCGLLSRYLRENKGGALVQGLAGLDMAPPPAAAAAAAGGGGGAAGAFQPPTTMNLLSGLEAPEPNAAVDEELSVDNGRLLKAPADENAREIGAGEEEHAQQLTIFYGGRVVVVDNFPSTEVKALLQMANAAGDGAVDKAAGSSSSAVPPSLPRPARTNLPADLPIARRNSLHRFLEKRKGRITAKAPYQVNSSSAAPSKQANGDNSWLWLGQEVAIKQEI